MRPLRTLCAALLSAGLACATAPAPDVASGAPARSDADAVAFSLLAPGVWMHRSASEVPSFGRVEANGVVVAAGSGAVVIDTAWTPAQTRELLDWTETHVGPVRAVIVTHWHADRIGGLSEVHRRGIPSFGEGRTVTEARAHGAPVPQHAFSDTLDLNQFGVDGEARFEGAGHSLDNTVVWLAAPRVLIGGCLIKAAAATSLGNIEDADLSAWPETVARVERRYPQASIVVPGHGEPGTTQLLQHTVAVLNGRQAAP